jgi:hypothetical protein
VNEVHTVEIPALDGRLPLGFLASLGLLVLLDDLAIETRLSFSPVTAAAVIHSPLLTLDDVAQVLADYVATTDKNTAITGVQPGFPLGGKTGDPMKKTREQYRALAAATVQTDPRAAAWLPHLATDLAVDNQGRGAVTPITAQDRNEGLAEFFKGPLTKIRDEPGRIREALSSWRRVPGTKALMLDYQALWFAADDQAGKRQQERGVPGATWLATMSLRLLRLTGNGHTAQATLWHQMRGRNVMLWPLWRQPLGTQAVQALIEHPAIVPVPQPDGKRGASEVAVRNASWRRLGIMGVYAATRIRAEGQKSQRVLTPIPVRVTE